MASVLNSAEPRAALPDVRAQGTFEGSVIAIFMAGACTFLNVYTTQSILPLLRVRFHSSEAMVALTVSASTLAVACAAPFVGLIAERFERKRMILSALLLLSVPTFMAATSTGLRSLILWRFAQGLAVPGITAVMMAYIGEEYPPNGVGFPMAAYVSGTALGGFLGRFIMGLIAENHDWRWAFVALGMLTLGGATTVWRWLPSSRRFVASRGAGATVRAAVAHVRNPLVLATFATGFLLLFGMIGTTTYANFYLASPPFRFTPEQLGSVFVIYLFGLLVTPLAGRYMDRRGYRRTIVLAVLTSLVGLAATLKLSVPFVIVGLTLMTSGVFAVQAATTAHLGLVSGGARSSAAGLYLSFYYAGGALGGVLPAFFWVRGGWPATVCVLVLACLLTLLAGFVASRRTGLLATGTG